ncbi:hypothetical protein F5X68DRAFT_4356 [Plectosphaerella plurivora]|uniref:Uncharacterized protein n=1 Tax=Plectosphaerella plurivora TaxID=936078 RepID=A0A9P8VKT3_9PEZI|nr:hypothetical protein F5X68DRAFT_4356 [Plectosphaerella plurivora]
MARRVINATSSPASVVVSQSFRGKSLSCSPRTLAGPFIIIQRPAMQTMRPSTRCHNNAETLSRLGLLLGRCVSLGLGRRRLGGGGLVCVGLLAVCGLGVGLGRVLGHLALEVLVLLGVVEHLRVVRVGEDLGAVAEEDDATLVAADAEVAASLLLGVVVVVLALAVVKVVVHARAAELG